MHVHEILGPFFILSHLFSIPSNSPTYPFTGRKIWFDPELAPPPFIDRGPLTLCLSRLSPSSAAGFLLFCEADGSSKSLVTFQGGEAKPSPLREGDFPCETEGSSD